MRETSRVAIIFFILLELIHIPGIPVLDKMRIYGPSDAKDVFLLPIFLAFVFFLLMLINLKINKGLLLGSIHIVLWTGIILTDKLTGEFRNCIDCEHSEFFLEALSACTCSFFVLFNHFIMESLSEKQTAYILTTFGINLLLFATYLLLMSNTAIFINRKVFVKKVK